MRGRTAARPATAGRTTDHSAVAATGAPARTPARGSAPRARRAAGSRRAWPAPASTARHASSSAARRVRRCDQQRRDARGCPRSPTGEPAAASPPGHLAALDPHRRAVALDARAQPARARRGSARPRPCGRSRAPPSRCSAPARPASRSRPMSAQRAVEDDRSPAAAIRARRRRRLARRRDCRAVPPRLRYHLPAPGVVISACAPGPSARSIARLSPPTMPAGGCTTIAWQTASGLPGAAPSARRSGPRVLAARRARSRSPRAANPSASRADQPRCGRASVRSGMRQTDEQAADAVAIHVLAAAAGHDLAPLHDQVVVGERAGEVVVLLDQQDGHFAGRGQRPDGALDVLDDRRLDALGRLVEDEQPRAHRQRAADGELLLLAAGEVAAAPAQHLLQHGEHRRRCAGGSGVRAGLLASPICRFSCTVRRGKISRPCGT